MTDVVANSDPNNNNTTKTVILAKEHLVSGLSLVNRTLDNSGFAFTKLVIQNQNISDASILKAFQHLRHLDLSKNSLSDITLVSDLPNLVSINLSFNNITEVPSALTNKKYLQVLDLSNNKLSKVSFESGPLLTLLSIKNNQLNSLTLNEFPNLVQLEIRGNQLKSTAGFCTAGLLKLYASDNHISEIKDLAFSPKLSVLHLRNNRLNSLEGIQSGLSISYLNVRQNQISRFSELDKLGVLTQLRHLVIMGNPISNEEIYRLESLFRVTQITRLDKDAILDEDREEVEAYKNNRVDPTAQESNSSDKPPGLSEDGNEEPATAGDS